MCGSKTLLAVKVKYRRGREKDEKLIQSRVKYYYHNIINIMVIQMNGAMRKINY